ncbi:unnamed protein product [Ixodes pacificus]
MHEEWVKTLRRGDNTKKKTTKNSNVRQEATFPETQGPSTEYRDVIIGTYPIALHSGPRDVTTFSVKVLETYELLLWRNTNLADNKQAC